MKYVFSLLFFCCFLTTLFAQQVERICPPNWWVGMKNTDLQLMVHGENISLCKVSINYPGVAIYKTTKVENANYLFIDLIIDAKTLPGILKINFINGKKTITSNYELAARETRTFNYGLSSKDFIYLLMPDRFANGDTSNDVHKEMKEKFYGRNSLTSRHGGDIQGIIDHLDYLQELGVTAIWSTPLLENDQQEWSYHGYAMTDHYKTDSRYGSNALYKNYVAQCHEKNMKVVMDLVHNHVGLEHWFVQDLPMTDWIHQWTGFTRSNYRTTTKVDPYASEFDKKIMDAGWFDVTMPDINQQNAMMANYIIQNNIWWIEYAHIDGFRLDTYPYSDLQFLKNWQAAINAEYPGFGVFGEVWVSGVGVQAYFKGDNALNTGYDSGLPSETDFNLYESLIKGVNDNFGWYDGIANVYHNLSQDYVYGDANKNVIFIGNHDLSRFYSICGENMQKMKIATAFILTTRGIPQWYYGDEILMKNFTNPDGRVREDFPGGWAEDKLDKFKEVNLQGSEKEFFGFVKKLANFRKTSYAITSGKLMQFVPFDGIYVYFRYSETESIMVVINTNKESKTLETKNYAERINGFTKARNILTDTELNNLSTLTIPAMDCVVLELKK